MADRQTQEVIRVNVTWNKKQIFPIAKLQDLTLTNRVSTRDNADTTYYIVGEAKALETPEVKSLYPNGYFHGEMYEMERDGWADFTYPLNSGEYRKQYPITILVYLKAPDVRDLAFIHNSRMW